MPEEGEGEVFYKVLPANMADHLRQSCVTISE